MEASVSQQFANHEPYALLEHVADPLELAAQALAKLKAHGLPEVIGDTLTLVQPQSTVMVQPEVGTPRFEASPPSSSAEVVIDLDEYRSRQNDLNSPSSLRLVERAQRGDTRAMSIICEKVMPIIRNYALKKAMAQRIDVDDIFQEAWSHVPGIVARYNTARGGKFSNFLITRILGAMIDQQRHDTPFSRGDYAKIKAAANSDGEVRKELIESLINDGLTMAPHLVGEGDVRMPSFSLDQAMYTEYSRASQEDMRVDSREPVAESDVSEEAVTNEELHNFTLALSGLSAKDQFVLIHSHGLFGTRPQTLAEIGAHFGVSESRVCQLKKAATESLHQALLSNANEVNRHNESLYGS